jgi:hypothetical protein
VGSQEERTSIADAVTVVVAAPVVGLGGPERAARHCTVVAEESVVRGLGIEGREKDVDAVSIAAAAAAAALLELAQVVEAWKHADAVWEPEVPIAAAASPGDMHSQKAHAAGRYVVTAVVRLQ